MRRFKNARSIRCAVIGYSGTFCMGRHHLLDMKRAGMTPTAVCELDAGLREVAANEFPGIETYASLASMLRNSDVNLIAVITPHNTHAKIATQCFRAGRHVVCEKPMAITTAECDRMIRAAKDRRVLLSAFHNRHWDGCVVQAVKTIRRGAIGQVHRVQASLGGHRKPAAWWRSSKSISGGVLYDWGVHFLEYALQIIDSRIVEVSGFAHNGYWAPRTRWKRDTGEDEATAVVRFANGAWLSLTASAIDAEPGPHWFTVVGTKGVYTFSHDVWKLTTMVGRHKRCKDGANPPSQWRRYYRNIAGHLVRGEPLIITAQWARRPIHILDLANRSAAKGSAIKAKYG